jgi:hypothetical protein
MLKNSDSCASDELINDLLFLVNYESLFSTVMVKSGIKDYPDQVRNMSLLADPTGESEAENCSKKIDKEFLEWFRGLCEAESNFTIKIRHTSDKNIRGFEFLFRIALHLDDLGALEHIQKNLNCGTIRKDRNTYVFIISRMDDIKTKLLPVFDFYNLNGIKHLDYLAFREGFLLYTERSFKANDPNLIDQILTLKNSMNDKRTCFLMPVNHTIKITDYYLLGLLEGDGSFYLYKSKFYTYVSIGTITHNILLLLKIKEYLISKMDNNSRLFVENTKLINISTKEFDGNRQSFSIIQFYNIDYIYNKIVPFLDGLNFQTKKYKDFVDFKTMVSLIYQGKHLIEEGKFVIYNIADQMNDNRLTTNSQKTVIPLDETKIQSILDLPPLILLEPDGRAKNTLTGQYIRTVNIIEAQIINNNTNEIQILKFYNALSCSEFFNLSYSLIIRYLNNGKSFTNNDQTITLKRIRIFN